MAFLVPLIPVAIGAAIGTVGVTTTVFVLAGGAAIGGLALLTHHLNRKDDKPQQEALQRDQRVDAVYPTNETIQSPVAPQRVIVGETTVAGAVCFADTNGAYIVKQYLLANHEIEDVLYMLIDGVPYTTDKYGYVNDEPFKQNVFTEFGEHSNGETNFDDPKFEDRNYLRANFRLGLPDQPVDMILRERFPEVGDNFRQLGHATATCEFFRGTIDTPQYNRYRQDSGTPNEVNRVGWSGSTPEPKFRVRGLKCFDPRDGKTKWTRNAALILTQIYLNKSLVRGIDQSNINYDQVAKAADICDRGFEINPTPKYPRGAIFRQYTLDGVIQTTEPLLQVLENMLLCSRSIMGWEGSQYAPRVSVQRKPVMTITDDDIIGNIGYNLEKKQADRVNTIRAKYKEDSDTGQILDAPAYTKGNVSEGSDITVNLNYTTNTYRAQYISKQILEELQLERRLIMPISRKGILLETGDVVSVYSVREPEINGEYALGEIAVSSDANSFLLNLKEFSNDIYSWNAGDEVVDEPFQVEPGRQ